MSEDDGTENHLARATKRGMELRSSLVRRGLQAVLARNFRLVLFPEDRSIGNLYIRDRSDAGEIGWQVRSKRLGEAKGIVRVPIENDLALIMSEEALDTLDWVFLDPDDLQALVFPPVTPDAEMLDFLEELTGLKLLKVRLSQVRDKELQCLKTLTSLRWLCLLGDELSEDELEDLRSELPNCVVLTESSTEGLVNENSAYTAKEMMELLNTKGYRNEDGQPFTNVDDFLRTLELDAAGVKKFYSVDYANIEDEDDPESDEASEPDYESQVATFQELINQSKGQREIFKDIQQESFGEIDPIRDAPRRQHYYFAHQYLRDRAQQNPEPLVDNLRKETGTKYLKFLWVSRGFAAKREEDDFIPADGLKCFPIEIGNEYFGALVEFPTPEKMTEAYFAAIILPVRAQPSVPAEFFTLEFSLNRSEGTILCKWVEGSHFNLGDGPPPQREAFVEAISKLLLDHENE